MNDPVFFVEFPVGAVHLYCPRIRVAVHPSRVDVEVIQRRPRGDAAPEVTLFFAMREYSDSKTLVEAFTACRQAIADSLSAILKDVHEVPIGTIVQAQQLFNNLNNAK